MLKAWALCAGGGGQLHSAVLGPLMPLRLNGAHQGPEGLQLGPLQAKDGTRPQDQGAPSQGAPGRLGRRGARGACATAEGKLPGGRGREAGSRGYLGATRGHRGGWRRGGTKVDSRVLSDPAHARGKTTAPGQMP